MTVAEVKNKIVCELGSSVQIQKLVFNTAVLVDDAVTLGSLQVVEGSVLTLVAVAYPALDNAAEVRSLILEELRSKGNSGTALAKLEAKDIAERRSWVQLPSEVSTVIFCASVLCDARYMVKAGYASLHQTKDGEHVKASDDGYVRAWKEFRPLENVKLRQL